MQTLKSTDATFGRIESDVGRIESDDGNARRLIEQARPAYFRSAIGLRLFRLDADGRLRPATPEQDAALRRLNRRAALERPEASENWQVRAEARTAEKTALDRLDAEVRALTSADLRRLEATLYGLPSVLTRVAGPPVDPVAGWIEARTTFDPEAVEPIFRLYADFLDWQRAHGLPTGAISRRAFAEALSAIQVERVELGPDGVRRRRGLRLQAPLRSSPAPRPGLLARLWAILLRPWGVPR